MSTLSIVIIGMILLAVFSMDMIRKSKLKMIDAALDAKNYDVVIQMAQGKMNRRLMTSYVCDLYYLRALYIQSPDEHFLEHLFDVYKKITEEDNKKDILETYFHLFLNKKNKDCASQILEKIMATNNEKFINVSQFAYDMVFHETSEHLTEMENLVEKLRGFDVGVTAYYIGMMYEKLGDVETALAYYNSCEGCFNPSHYYLKQAKAKVEELTEHIEKE